jgi:hypothetical protein
MWRTLLPRGTAGQVRERGAVLILLHLEQLHLAAQQQQFTLLVSEGLVEAGNRIFLERQLALQIVQKQVEIGFIHRGRASIQNGTAG